jgi:hypothetical protein
MRYIVADEQPVNLPDIGKAFAEAGVEYDVDGKETEVTISYDGRPIGHITRTYPETVYSRRNATSLSSLRRTVTKAKSVV